MQFSYSVIKEQFLQFVIFQADIYDGRFACDELKHWDT